MMNGGEDGVPRSKNNKKIDMQDPPVAASTARDPAARRRQRLTKCVFVCFVHVYLSVVVKPKVTSAQQ
jgi:hypothetical protein